VGDLWVSEWRNWGDAFVISEHDIKDTLRDTKMEAPEQRMQQLKLTGQS